MLLAQVVLFILSQEINPNSDFELWLWDLDKEHNIPSTLASMQLAFVGVVALFTAWIGTTRPAWQRFYLVGISLLFLFLGLDEYFEIYKLLFTSRLTGYTILGVTTVLSTAFVALRSTRRSWISHIFLLAGLTLIALGGFVLDETPQPCGNLGFLRIDGCIRLTVFEEVLELAGGWLVLTAMLSFFSNAVPAPGFRVRRIMYTFPALWIFAIFLNSMVPRLQLQQLAQPTLVEFEDEVRVNGYFLERREDAVVIQLYVSARQKDFVGVWGYSIRLVDLVTDDSVVMQNVQADRQHGFWFFGPAYVPVYQQRMELRFSPEVSFNRALRVEMMIRRQVGGGSVPLQVLSSDLPHLENTKVVLGELVIPAVSVASDGAPVAVFDNGFSLAAVEMPEHAEPGQNLTIGFTWRSDAQGQDDYAQFLHFINEESGSWWNFDQQPLGRRLPTRLWYNGLADVEEWRIPVPADLAPGRYAVYTGLYHMQNQQRIPVSTAVGTPLADARVPLGVLIIE